MTGQSEKQSVNKLRFNSAAALSQHRFIRFLLVGGLNTVFSYCVYAFFLFLGFTYALANLLALIIGILFSFKTQGAFVFNNSDNQLLGRFVICWALIYFGNIVFIREMLILGLDAYFAGALAIPFITVLSYLMQKFIVFRRVGSSKGHSFQMRRHGVTSASEKK